MNLHRLPCVVLLAVVLLLPSPASSGMLNSLSEKAHATAPGPPQLCPTHPLPSASASQLASLMAPALQEAEGKISAALKADNSPGGAVLSLVYGDDVIWSKGFGLVNMSDPGRGAPTSSTGFRIGSITKLFTALLTLIIRDTGALRSINQDVRDYLKEFSVKNPFQSHRGVTYRQLMSHMSGLPRNPPCKDIFLHGCSLSDEEIYKNLADIALMYPPGSQPAYSNLGFGLLGRALEPITHAKWETILKTLVFDHLGFKNSGNSFTPADVSKMAIGYYSHGGQAEFIDMGWDAPAGQMYSSTDDLAKLMSLTFKTDNPTTGQLLDAESIREWLAPAYVYPDGSGFSYPWELVPLGNYTLRTKDGRINGYEAEFQMAPEIKTGFIFLQSCDDCASHAAVTSVGQRLILEADRLLRGVQTGVPEPANLMDYVGSYSAVVYGVKDVTNVTFAMLFGHPTLLTTEGGDTALLQWVEGDSFQISVQGLPVPCFVLSSGHIGGRVYFQRDSSSQGKVVSLTVPGIAYGHVYNKDS